MQELIKHTVLNNSLLLSASRCMFWEEDKALIISDCHFGKTGHFRKNGIAVPQMVFKEDMQRLAAQVQFFKPDYLMIVGDLFHSHANKEMDMFLRWRKDFSTLPVKLIAGNHDILGEDWYSGAGIDFYKRQKQTGPFVFCHDEPEAASYEGKFIFSGHVHPAITLSGLAKQAIKMPCFYFTKSMAILPAFGRFTGLHSVTPKKNDTVFALYENKIIRV